MYNVLLKLSLLRPHNNVSVVLLKCLFDIIKPVIIITMHALLYMHIILFNHISHNYYLTVAMAQWLHAFRDTSIPRMIQG